MMTTMPIGHPFESASRLGRTAAPAPPRPIWHRVGAPFAQDGVAAVDIGVNDGSILCSIPTASDARAREHWLLSLVGLIGGKRVVVQKTRLAGFALLPREPPGSPPVWLCRSTAR